jgi:hypothetical protein
VILSPDHLPADDRFYFSLNVRDKVKILVVDGDPKASLKAGESFYLVSALDPQGMQGTPFLVRVITEGELAREAPGSFDILFLMNIERPDLTRISSFLDMGKPLFLFLGDRILPEAYNGLSQFPFKIGSRIDAGGEPQRIELAHPARTALGFLRPLEKSLRGASFHRYFRIEEGTEALLGLGNGDPLLVAANVGNSRVYLFASSADLDWNDLPLTASYVPLLQALVKQAVGLVGDSLPPGIPFGEHLSEADQPLQIKGIPGGPGIYQYHVPPGTHLRAVNPPYEESDLSKIPVEELKKKFGGMETTIFNLTEGGLKSLQGGRKPIWPALLIFLLLVLALEMLLADGLRPPLFPKGSAAKAGRG